MKNYTKLATAIIGCELVGLTGTVFTASAIPEWYSTLTKPAFAPPNWLFGPVWTVLYALMGISAYLIWKRTPLTKKHRRALTIFLTQLSLNFIWTPLFFGLKSPELALVVIIALLGSIVWTMRVFYPLSRTAALLLVPYLLWVSFATLLNAGIAVLN